MKKIIVVLSIFLINVKGVCAEQELVSKEISSALKDHSRDPSALSVILSLLFVLCLIYVTGIIYSKLNVYGAKTIKKQMKKHNLASITVLSTTQLGQGKNLHIIELQGKQMLIGATPNSINLLKELDFCKEKLEDEIDNQFKKEAKL